MPETDVNVIGHMVLDPDLPLNPGANMWNPATGQMIVNDFTTGRLYQAIDRAFATRGSRAVELSQLTVIGKVTAGDVRDASSYQYTNLKVLDMSRTDIETLGWHAFSSNPLNVLVLPASVKEIGAAFDELNNVTEIRLWATVPPEVTAASFENFSQYKFCVLRVPAESVALYQQADFWKEMIVMPIEDNVRTLSVSLPDNYEDGVYLNNRIELEDLATGIRQILLVTHKQNYQFGNLPDGAMYNMYMYSPEDAELARINNILVSGSDLDVAFEHIKLTYSIGAMVKANGGDVTPNCIVRWYEEKPDGTNAFLREGSILENAVEGMRIVCSAELSQDLGRLYRVPDNVIFNVSEQKGQVMIDLQELPQTYATGKVLNTSGMQVAQGSVTIRSVTNGKYPTQVTTQVGSTGQWQAVLKEAPEYIVTYSANGCVNRTDTVPMRLFQANTDFGTVKLQPLTGAYIDYGVTFAEAVVTSDAPADKHRYNDYMNVDFAVRNLTKKVDVKKLSVQFPKIVLLDGNAEKGDKLRITASSKNHDFEPMDFEVTLDENLSARTVFDLVGLGGVITRFKMTDSPAVRSLLFDEKGNLLATVLDSDASTRFLNLRSGNYTVVTMADIPLAKGISRLSSLDDLGFVRGRDYALNAVEVTQGVLTEVMNDVIPTLDTERFNYLTASSIMAVNKNNVTAGQNLTVRCVADFKESYRPRVKNVKLVFDLPDGLDMVANSLMYGNALASYDLRPNKLIVPVDGKCGEQVRFVVSPSTDGVKNIMASYSFDIDGKSVLQPIGSASVEVENVVICAPDIISNADFNVSGIAPARSNVKVYDGKTLIGEASVSPNGSWNANCSLVAPQNLSTHEVFAEIETYDKTLLRSETVAVHYDSDAITLQRITMTNMLPSSSQTVVFDYTTGNNRHQTYSYNPAYPDFTFKIELSDNDPQKVSHMTLYVYTSDDDTRKLKPVFDATLGCWIASGKFTAGSLPCNADVSFLSQHEIKSDYSGYQTTQEMLQNARMEIAQYKRDALPILEQMKALDPNDPDSIDKLRGLMIDFYTAMGDPEALGDGSLTAGMTDEEIVQAMYDETEWEKSQTDYSEYIDGFMSAPSYGTFEHAGMIYTLKPLNEVSVNYSSWTRETGIDGETVYSRLDTSANKFEMVFTGMNLYICTQMTAPAMEEMRALMLAAAKDDLPGMMAWKTKLGETVAMLVEKMSSCEDWINKLIDAIPKMRHNIKVDKLFNNPEWVKEANATGLMDKVYYHINIPVSSMSYYTSKCLVACLSCLKYGLPFYTAYQFGKATLEDCQKLIDTWYMVPDPCPDDEQAANAARRHTGTLMASFAVYSIWQATSLASSFAAIIPATVAAIPSGGLTLGAECAIIVTSVAACWAWENGFPYVRNAIIEEIEDLRCHKDCECLKGGPCRCAVKCRCKKRKKPDPADGIIDPSGYVYEAVPSNRVEGVQSTIYYKETVEDMYGDPVVQEMVWNAEEYAQRNPLFTDDQGMYQWDVPAGLWQVRFKKDGYFDTQSEWLPVPPPQLDVNVPITSKAAPMVLKARAYEEGIMIQFDKYMKPGTIDKSTVFVTLNDAEVPGKLSAVNEELSDPYAKDESASTAPRYASLYRFIPDTPLSTADGKIRLTVSAAVEDYSGMNMATNFTQEFEIEKEVAAIRAAELTHVLRGSDKQIVVDVVPFDAAVGKTLNIVNPAPLAIDIDMPSVVIDENGQARFNVHGNLAGTLNIGLSVQDSWTTGTAAVAVVDELYEVSAPVASRASGTQVYRGTRIALSTDVPNATIYYTTDGSCPCDNDRRLTYWLPIEINEPTTIKAMVVTNLGEESSTAEFSYTLRTGSTDLKIEKGWNWISHNLDRDVAVSELSSDARIEKILGAEGESSSALKTLAPGQSYKVKASANLPTAHVEGVALNPSAPLAVVPGLNWVGYAPAKKLSISEAVAQSYLEAGDCFVGREGFSQFNGSEWEGTLDSLEPGAGYQFYSSSEKHVIFANPTTAYSQARRVPANPTQANLKTDSRKYPQVMCMVLNLANKQGEILSADDYALGAFCGDECRGVARVVNGKYMMSVYGNAGDKIEVVVIPNGKKNPETASDKFTLADKMIGSVNNPYVLNMGTVSIDEALIAGWEVEVDGMRLRLSGNTDSVKRLSLYDLEGCKVGETLNAAQGIAVGHLPVGVYIVTVAEADSNSYRKIVIK